MSIEEDRFEVQSDVYANEATTLASGASTTVDLTGYTLIVPSVSIGSVAQLAVDVLLTNENGKRALNERPTYVCDLDPRFCIPFVGPSSASDQQPVLRTALQVYAFRNASLAVVQQRSPVLKARKEEFIAALHAWCLRKRFAQVIVLSSVDAGLRSDEQMRQPFWLYAPSFSSSKQQQQIKSDKAKSIIQLLVNNLPAYTSASTMATKASANNDQAQIQQANRLPPMPSAGLTRKLLSYFKLHSSDNNNMNIAALLVFAAEGDNRADAMAMAALLFDAATQAEKTQSANDKINKVAFLIAPTTLAEPNDWKLLFGQTWEPGMF